MKRIFIAFLAYISLITLSAAQSSLLQSGPMVGYSAMREVKLWVQTNTEANVHIEYWEEGKAKERQKTNSVTTTKKEAFVAHLIADEVEPGQTYNYELFINQKAVKLDYKLKFKTQPLWQWRTDPPDFKFAIGSCFFVNEAEYDRPGKPYGSNFQIFDHILDQQPEFMLWLGDNTYLREADFDSYTGMVKRYTHSRSHEAIQPLLGSVHNYAIWDDHDFGPNNSDASFAYKDLTLDLFKKFWANPNYGLPNGQGITGTFSWHDVEFFLLDNRYFRTADNNHVTERQMLGKEQIDWLINALASSYAPFKVIVAGGQMLNPTESHENYAIFKEERAHLLDLLRKSRVEGILFFSGDIHHTEMSKLKESESDYPIYEFTVSSLTAGSTSTSNNPLMVDATGVYEQNFGLFSVTGPRKNRKLTVQIINANGKLRWEKSIEESELKY